MYLNGGANKAPFFFATKISDIMVCKKKRNLANKHEGFANKG